MHSLHFSPAISFKIYYCQFLGLQNINAYQTSYSKNGAWAFHTRINRPSQNIAGMQIEARYSTAAVSDIFKAGTVGNLGMVMYIFFTLGVLNTRN
jgi:hypothetical protein